MACRKDTPSAHDHHLRYIGILFDAALTLLLLFKDLIGHHLHVPWNTRNTETRAFFRLEFTGSFLPAPSLTPLFDLVPMFLRFQDKLGDLMTLDLEDIKIIPAVILAPTLVNLDLPTGEFGLLPILRLGPDQPGDRIHCVDGSM